MRDLSSPIRCFEVLQLPKTATEKQIKAAYRKLAVRYHPDRNPNNRMAEEKFKELVQVYETLLDYVRQQSPSPDPTGVSAAQPRPDADNSMAAFQQWLTAKQRHHSSQVMDLSAEEQHAKSGLLRKFRQLLKAGEWQQVVQGVEELSAGLQNDLEICAIKARAYYAKAMLLLDQWQYDQACRYIQEAVWTDPYNSVFRTKLRRIHLYVGRLRELAAFLQAIEQAYPDAGASSAKSQPQSKLLAICQSVCQKAQVKIQQNCQEVKMAQQNSASQPPQDSKAATDCAPHQTSAKATEIPIATAQPATEIVKQWLRQQFKTTVVVTAFSLTTVVFLLFIHNILFYSPEPSQVAPIRSMEPENRR